MWSTQSRVGLSLKRYHTNFGEKIVLYSWGCKNIWSRGRRFSAFTICKASSCYTSPFQRAVLLLTQCRGRVPEKLYSCSKQQVVEEREDVLHSSLVASFWMAGAQFCGGQRNQGGFPTLLSAVQHRCCKCLLVSLGHLNHYLMCKKKLGWPSALPLKLGGGCTLHSWKCNTASVLLSLLSPSWCLASPRAGLELGKEGSAPLWLLSPCQGEVPCSCWVSSFAARRVPVPLSMGTLLSCNWLGLPKPVRHVPIVTQLLVLSSTCPAVSQWGRLGQAVLNGSYLDFLFSGKFSTIWNLVLD